MKTDKGDYEVGGSNPGWADSEESSDDPLREQVGGDHYKSCKIQPIEYCQANQLNACESNVVKYITRHKQKGGIQDLDKAIHYVELLKKLEYGIEQTSNSDGYNKEDHQGNSLE